MTTALRRAADAVPDPGAAYRSDLHDTKLAAALGTALGVTFGICFVTGLISHVIQHPVGWFTWPARPAGLYRILAEGIDIHIVSERLGHSGTHITREIYTHVTPPMQSDAADRVAKRIFGGDRRPQSKS